MKRLYEVELNSKGAPNFSTAKEVQERKKGKWEIIFAANEFGEPYPCGCSCSECGFQNVVEDNYCPNCGADMRGDSE